MQYQTCVLAFNSPPFLFSLLTAGLLVLTRLVEGPLGLSSGVPLSLLSIPTVKTYFRSSYNPVSMQSNLISSKREDQRVYGNLPLVSKSLSTSAAAKPAKISLAIACYKRYHVVSNIVRELNVYDVKKGG